jgi:hypothetical protein
MGMEELHKEVRLMQDGDPKDLAMHLVLFVRGSLGAVWLKVMLPVSWRLMDRMDDAEIPRSFDRPIPLDVGYHSYGPREYASMMPDCPILNGSTCYYDGSTLPADEIFKTLMKDGQDAVFDELAKLYVEFLEDGNDG